MGLHKEYPRTVITIVLQVASSDGSLGAVAGNAAFLALLDAGVAMRATALSVSIGVQLGGKEELGDAAVLCLDPTAAEERECSAVLTVSVDSNREQLVSSLSTGGALDAVTWANCVAAGAKACKVLEAFLRMSLQKRLEVFLRPTEAEAPAKRLKAPADAEGVDAPVKAGLHSNLDAPAKRRKK